MEYKVKHDLKININQKHVVQRLVAEVYFFILGHVSVGVIQFSCLHETTLVSFSFFHGLTAVNFTARLSSVQLNTNFT